jgi:hypothetical protein
MVDLEQQRLVGLDDERPVGHTCGTPHKNPAEAGGERDLPRAPAGDPFGGTPPPGLDEGVIDHFGYAVPALSESARVPPRSYRVLEVIALPQRARVGAGGARSTRAGTADRPAPDRRRDGSTRCPLHCSPSLAPAPGHPPPLDRSSACSVSRAITRACQSSLDRRRQSSGGR